MAVNPGSWGVLGNPSKEKIQEYQNMPVGGFKSLVTRLSRGKKGKAMKEMTVYVTKKNITATRGTLKLTAFEWTDAADAARLRTEEIVWDAEPYKTNYEEFVYHSVDPTKYR